MRDSVRHLGKGVAIYGAGDAAVQAVSLLLLPIYVKFDYLLTADYGAIGLIVAVEMVAKIVSRWGLDGAFMRFYHERAPGIARDRLTGTIVWFTVVANLAVFGPALLGSGWIGRQLFENPQHVMGLQLMLANTLLLSLTYVPFHQMRLENQAAKFSAINVARSAGTVAARVALVIWAGWGVAGWFAADLAITVLTWLGLGWRLTAAARAGWSRTELSQLLRFGLPRLPHGLAQQGLDAGNKMLLNNYIPQGQLGVYQNGFTLGTAIRFFTSAFETAWAPFYYTSARSPGAPTLFGKITTYGVAILTLLSALTMVVARDVVLVMLTPEYLAAAPVIPLIAIGMSLQGVYLMTSIGLNLTNRTRHYPVATFCALGVGLGAGFALMPRYGIVGAAIAFLASALTQTSVAFALARRAYVIPYESARLLRVIFAGVLASLAGLWLVPGMAPLLGLVVRPAVATIVFVSVLAATGFFRRTEWEFLEELRRRLASIRADRTAAG